MATKKKQQAAKPVNGKLNKGSTANAAAKAFAGMYNTTPLTVRDIVEAAEAGTIPMDTPLATSSGPNRIMPLKQVSPGFVRRQVKATGDKYSFEVGPKGSRAPTVVLVG